MNGNITEYGNDWHIQIEREKMNSTLAIKVAVVVFGTDKNQIIIYEEVAAFNSRTSLLLLPPDDLLHRCIGMIDFNCPVSGQFPKLVQTGCIDLIIINESRRYHRLDEHATRNKK